MKRIGLAALCLMVLGLPLRGICETAVYDALTWHTPVCTSGVSPCTAPSALLNGRDTMSGGNEPNQPNTLSTSPCADGTSGTYHSDESLDAVTITDLDGPEFLPGDLVRVDATVWCWASDSTDSLYVYQADDPSSPVWSYKGTAACASSGSGVLSVSFTLGSGMPLQAVRAAFTYSSSAASCDTGGYNDRDDLLITMVEPTDSDGDGMTDRYENTFGCLMPDTVDASVDYDADGMTSLEEFQYSPSLDPCNPDTDGDGLSDGEEVSVYGTDPLNPDTDSDGMPDGWELANGLNPLFNDALLDADGDGLNNLGEYQNSSDPNNPDTDGDGMNDGWEVAHGLDPLTDDSASDPDGDGLANLVEYQQAADPQNPDTDGDGLNDGVEVNTFGTDPLNADTDGDGLNDGDEINTHGTDPLNPDTDGDQMPDGWEITNILNPLADDASNDPDGDGLDNLGEYQNGTDPHIADMDGDGLSDGEEVNTWLTDPLNSDTDGDFLSDGDEVNIYGTNPLDADSDGDGASDALEIGLGADPLNASICPALYGQLGPQTRVTYASGRSDAAYLAWSGSEYGLTWEDYRDPNSSIYFARISEGGGKLGTDVLVSDTASSSVIPFMAWTGSEFGVSWLDYPARFMFARLSSAGVKLGTDLVVSNWGAGMVPSLAWTGSEFGISWYDDRNGYDDIFFARISAAGLKVGGDLRIRVGNSNSEYPNLVWSGSEFGVSWQDDYPGNYEIYFARISASGTIMGLETRVTYDAQTSELPCLAWNGSGFGLAWTDDRDGNGEIYFTRLSPMGVKQGADVRVTYAADDSRLPSLAWTGSYYGVTWRDARNLSYPVYDAYFARISPTGAKLGGDFRVTNGAGSSWIRTLAWSGSEFGLAWDNDDSNSPEIYFTRIGWDDGDGDGLTIAQEEAAGTDPYDWDTDDDGLSDADELNTYGTDPLAADADGDGLTDPDELALGTDPYNPDTDGDGLTDGAEVNNDFTDPLAWDTDGDLIPDDYEVAHESGGTPLDPLDASDGDTNFEPMGFTDNNPNFEEYWNGSDPWTRDPAPDPLFPGGPGCYYWGEGDGDGYVQANDKSILLSEVLGISQAYDNVLPRGVPDVQDLDADGFILAGDLSILKSFIVNGLVGSIGSRAASLEKAYEPLSPVIVGGTAHITVRVRNENAENNLYSAGFAVVFSIDPSSTGAAVLLGGDGSYGPGTRFDVSGISGAADGGRATIHLKATAAGTIIVNARIPACGTSGIGRWADEITLDPAFSISAAGL